MLHARSVQLGHWYERPRFDVTLHIENLVDLVFRSHAKCTVVFHQEAALSRMEIGTAASTFTVVLAGNLFIVAFITIVSAPCGDGCGFFER